MKLECSLVGWEEKCVHGSVWSKRVIPNADVLPADNQELSVVDFHFLGKR